MQPKKNLIRLVKDNQNQVFIDPSFKANGRGAYICNNIDCIEKAKKTKALNRAFKCEINEEVYEKLKSDTQNI